MTARAAVFLMAACLPLAAAAQPSTFTYQGYLTESGTAAEGAFDFELALYTIDSGGTAIDVNAFDDVTVTGGLFSLPADFTGAPFEAGGDYWVEARVRDGADTSAFTPLLPRQPVNASPYAIAAQAVIAPLDVAGDATVQGELNVGGDIRTVNEVRAQRVEAAEIWADGPTDLLGGAVIQRGGDNVALVVGNDGPSQPAARVVGDIEVGGEVRCSSTNGCLNADALSFPVYARSGDLEVIEDTQSVGANGIGAVTAYCRQTDHILLLGDCPSGGQSTLIAVGSRVEGFDSGGAIPSAKMGFTCRYRNTSTNLSEVGTVRAFCVAPDS